jgi:hypothetical protein
VNIINITSTNLSTTRYNVRSEKITPSSVFLSVFKKSHILVKNELKASINIPKILSNIDIPASINFVSIKSSFLSNS